MKKFLVILLTCAVTASIVAGGGAQQAPTGAVGQRVTIQVTPTSLPVRPQFDLGESRWHPQPARSYSTNPLFPQQPAVSNTNGFPIVQEPVTLKLITSFSSSILDYYDNDLTRHMEALTNVRIEWDILPEGGGTERLNLMFASGDNLPDVIYGVGIDSVTQISLGSAGLLIPLQDLIIEHGYNIQALMDYDPDYFASMLSADGNIYALSDRAENLANQVNVRFWINQHFLDTLGLQMPRTTEEYYRYLIAVRDRNPNGSGRFDEIPLVGDTTSWSGRIDGFLMNAFIFNDTSRRMFFTENGRVDVSYNKPEWRQGLEYLHRLQAEGLMAPESFTLVANELRALVEHPDYAIVGSLPSGGYNAFADVSGPRRTEYRVVPPLTGPNGVQQAVWSRFANTRIGRFAISHTNPYPEVSIKWADYGLTPDFWTRNRYGVLGRDWLIPPPGTPAVAGGNAMYEEILRWGSQTNAYWGAGFQWTQFASYNRALSPDPFELEFVLWNAREIYYPFRFERIMPTALPFTVDEAREFNGLLESINSHVNQSLARFVMGWDVLNDSNWNAYVQTLDRMGLPQLLRITQAAFDRSWAESLGFRR